MRDAQHGVEPLGGPGPATVIQDLPIGVLEIDDHGRVIQVNPAFVRLLPPGPGWTAGGGEGPTVVDCWPVLADAAMAALSGRSVDTMLVTPRLVLRVRAVPRVTGSRVHGGLLVVAEGERPRPEVVDLRDRRPPLSGDDVPGDPGIGTARTGPTRRTVLVWRRNLAGAGSTPDQGPAAGSGPGSGLAEQQADPAGTGGRSSALVVPRTAPRTPGRQRQTGGHADQHAATHDAVTGLPNAVLLRQCLSSALATCGPGHRVGLLVVEPSGTGLESRDVAGRLMGIAGPRDVVGRLRDDRFAVVLPQLAAGTDLESFLTRVTAQLTVRVNGDGDGLSPRGKASSPDRLGLAFVDPVHGSDAERDPRVVLALALEALERSRGSGIPVVVPERSVDAERARVAALRSYDIHDTSLDDVLRSVAHLAARACSAFAGLVTFVDEDLQWIRAASRPDLPGCVDAHGPRHLSLCDRTLRGRDVVVVRDVEQDADYRASRHVSWQTGMRFYAGAPLITPEGRTVGTLCVLDPLPRTLTERQRRSLAALAAEAVALMEAHRSRH
ncbi:MAG: hypothetical protein QG622_3611 [Actinomycetota bacterium]|nr:hypothetical protein [Actinomycetota bacterium]